MTSALPPGAGTVRAMAGLTTDAVAAMIGALCGLVATPLLAGWSLTVPDRANVRWYRGARTTGRRRAVTAAVAVAFGGLAGRAAGWTTALPAWAALALVLSVLALIDAQCHRLPDRLVGSGYLIGAVLLGVAAVTSRDWAALARAGLAGAVVFAAFALVRLAGGIGYGDVKLAGLLGGYLGWLGWTEVVGGVFVGFVLGAVLALVLMVTGRAGPRSPIAFGPPLIVGVLLVAALSS